ncbi:MAG: DUF763 domain-containing protein [Nitrososphaerota archaeon]|nr:DUF763 domain-containing protein [Candidatus Calditenuaceae archaeon]MDW8073091.1 DUF763 domain-containing protein [Nitrososphaerota archaeon]
MFRVGAIDLRAGPPTLNRRLYHEVSSTLPAIVDSFLGYFGSSEFIEMLANPWTFRLFCRSVDLSNEDAGDIVILVSSLMNNLRREWEINVAGGLYTKRFTVPETVERVSSVMGLSDRQAEWLKHSSRMTAKVDDVAVQDGFRLWLHVIVFNNQAEWAVIQLASKAGLNRLYQWHSGRITFSRFTVEPHTGVSSAMRSFYSLDFTLKKNLELQRGCIEVLSYPVSRLKSIKLGIGNNQTRLSDFSEDGIVGDVNPLTAPVRVNWSAITRVAESPPDDFERLLAVKGMGAETLRFLAICCHNVLGITPCLEDVVTLFSEFSEKRPLDSKTYQLMWDLIEAVRYSLLSSEKSRLIASKLVSIVEGEEQRG